MTSLAETSKIVDTLAAWLEPRIDPQAQSWLTGVLSASAEGNKKSLFLSFGLAARKVGKADLALTSEELAAAKAARPGWNPRNWTIDQATRMLLVLSYRASDASGYVAVMDQLFAAGEVQELVALYQGLPLFPHPAEFQLRCAEGLRTNMKSVFAAIAHCNPYPSEQLNDAQWNQLVLKSVFIGIPLDPIVGLDQRANATLARILVDFAEERWAASRPVTPELWRCVGPFAVQAGALPALDRLLTTGSDLERQAARLALESCASPKLKSTDVGSTASTTWQQISESASDR